MFVSDCVCVVLMGLLWFVGWAGYCRDFSDGFAGLFRLVWGLWVGCLICLRVGWFCRGLDICG